LHLENGGAKFAPPFLFWFEVVWRYNWLTLEVALARRNNLIPLQAFPYNLFP